MRPAPAFVALVCVCGCPATHVAAPDASAADACTTPDAQLHDGSVDGVDAVDFVDGVDASDTADAQVIAPDAEAVPAPFYVGAEPFDGGVEFHVWAPHASAAAVTLEWAPDAGLVVPLAAQDGGTFWARVGEAGVGQSYRFTLTHGGQELKRLDPRARQVSGSSAIIVDPKSYAWQTAPFTPPRREEAIVYELHVAAFGGKDPGAGTFAGVVGRLDHLRTLGVNAIELMPVNDFPGRGWGYNPQGYFAPNPSYGTPDELRRLVDEAHARGIAVLLDVVYNHYDGWSGAPLYCFDGDCTGNAGIYFFPSAPYASTPWGPRPNYARSEVADFISDSISLWMREYRVDGFRWDSTCNIRALDGSGDVPGGRALLQRANELAHATTPGALSIAEDLKGWGELTLPVASGGFGFDAQWDGFGWALDDAVVGVSDAARNMGAVRDALVGSYNGNPFQRLLFTDNHDVDGNGSVRLSQKIDPADPGSWAARKRTMLAAGVLLTAPGVPMLFMGQEFLERGGFVDPPKPLDWTNEQSYGPVQLFYVDLIRLRRNLDGVSAGLLCPQVNAFHVNDSTKVLAFQRRCASGGDVVVVANFGNVNYPRYDVGLPAKGVWHVRANSDDKRYSTDFGGASSADVTALDLPRDGLPFTGPIVLGPYSIVVLSP